MKKRIVPDCSHCIYKETCDRAKKGSFCTRFTSERKEAK